MAWKPVYATVPEFKDWKRLRNVADVDDDAVIALKLAAASRAVDKSTGRQFGKLDAAAERTYDVRWSRSFGGYYTEIDDLMDVTGLTVAVDGVTVDAADYKLRPRNAVADGRPYTYIVVTASVPGDGELAMSGLWGWNQPWPAEVTEATCLQASRLLIRNGSPYGIAGGSDSGSELRLLERLDPDIAPILAGVVRTGWVARS